MTGLNMEAGFRVTVLQCCEVRFPEPPGGWVICGDRGLLQATRDSCTAWSEADGDRRQDGDL